MVEGPKVRSFTLLFWARRLLVVRNGLQRAATIPRSGATGLREKKANMRVEDYRRHLFEVAVHHIYYVSNA